MSFILDALKKSESERQQQNTPGIANIPESDKPRPVSKWVWIIGVLLIANLGALAYVLLKPGPSPNETETTAMAAEPASAEALPVEPLPTESVPTESTADPIQQPDTMTAAAPSPAPVLQETSLEAPGPEVSDVQPGPAPRPASATNLASFNELRAQGVLQLSDLHIDIHVYSETPEDRFVFINMSKYTEGSTLTEGPAVREITPDGVALDYRGTEFLLPRE
jgi:general secretion pathway protein B